MKKIFFLVLIGFLSAGFLYAQSADEKMVRNIMDEQMKAWNAGDINGYMAGYWQSDSLMFVGKDGVSYGWEKAKNSYLHSYPDTVTMGKLDFTIIEIKRLSVLYFYVVGNWHLKRTVGDIGGHFTLLFKKVKNKWVIVVDHTS